jgi:hypothetical protein
MKAVHLEPETSTSLGAPTAPFEAIELRDALKEDAPGWREAILAEARSLQQMNTFTIMRGEVPNGKKLISCRWVLKKKFNSQMHLIRKKARMVIRGNEQQAGIDYFETFASVLRYTTLRILLAKAAAEDLEAEHVDIDTAFLNPDLMEEVYMKVPQFLEEVYPELREIVDAFLKLNKSLYGLKQAPRAWFYMVKKFFQELGLKSSTADPNLFTGHGVSILLFVDDMLIVGKRQQVDTMKAKILKQWKGKDLKAVDTFVGFQIVRNRKERTLTIHQSFYTTKLLERLGMDKSNPVALPIPTGTVLKSDDNFLEGDDITVYRQIVGSTIFLANNTRPDISYTVGQLARFMSKPAMIHYQYSKILLRYLNGTREVGITYSNRRGQLPRSYNVWTDATWGTEEDRVSFQGMVVIRYGGAINWHAQRQRSTALSSMEAEIMAASEGAKEMAWMEKLTADIEENAPYTPTLYCDNQGGLEWMKDSKFHNKSKHIGIRYMFVRTDMVEQGRLKVEYIPGKDQMADILTKQLPGEAFRKHARAMGLNVRG